MYDNFENAKQKLFGTFCYYDGRAVLVKDVQQKFKDPNNPDYGNVIINVYLVYLDHKGGGGLWRTLDDPKLQYMEFNMGYLNTMGYALWHYRIPHKQWKQGLHASQVGTRDKSGLTNHHAYANFGANNETAAMMEDRYPSFDVAVEMLNDPKFIKVAFHRDFAIYKDAFRKDLVLEHKGYPAAFEKFPRFFMCNDKMAYLKESIAEMNIKVAI